MVILLLRNCGSLKKGTRHYVAYVVPHGGYTDDAKQYVLNDGTHIRSGLAEEVA
ncbi:hypothetical protein D3C71_1685310 [compost metagenome]